MANQKWTSKEGTFEVVHTLNDSEGIRITNKLLKKIVGDIAQKSYNQVIDSQLIPPFAYREKQFHTVMLPAIEKNFDYFLMESPVTRNWKTLDKSLSDNYGWVDYWSTYNDYDYYIEVKHGYNSFKTNKVRKNEIGNWNKACEQLEVLNDEIETQLEYSNGIFRIAFQSLVCYGFSQTKINLEDQEINLGKKFILDAIESISEKNQCNWACLWRLDKSIDRIHEFSNGFERYPAVLFLVKVFDLINT